MAKKIKKTVIDAEPGGRKLYHRELNELIREAVRDGFNWITLINVCGQRFIGAGIKEEVTIEVFGDAGLDLGVFSEGASIIVHGCSEYLLGNTLNGGELVVYGDSWDITGMGARDGRMFVLGDGGSRIGIHMKECEDKKPAIVYGGRVKQYCGEYMAGGVIVVLGLDYSNALRDKGKDLKRDNIDPGKIVDFVGEIVQSDLGAGIHGGSIYVRGEVPDDVLGVHASRGVFDDGDKKILSPLLDRFSELFNTPTDLIWSKGFTKIVPISSRPFGKVYTPTPI